MIHQKVCMASQLPLINRESFKNTIYYLTRCFIFTLKEIKS